PLKANGDVAPLRIIRSAPADKVGLKFGKTEAVAYDSKRQELLVPNCVNHPQIAAFSRLAKENTPPTRTLEGQKTLISRTMHDLAYDPTHDEIVVTSPLTQAILVFRGGANGEEAPIRVDPLHNLLVVPSGGFRGGRGSPSLLIFDRNASGNAKPLRVIRGAKTELAGSQQMAITPQGWILCGARGGAIGIWNINDDGD